ncbi:ketopantoate reductase family protein [Candidatus Uabimicrobium sp. HlEnr_7]|uniref:ketopantoate reductase family protein n=1 Tax=Candidatus Uabimicrobium helgolandensis TaxID=3095367 RepID=UPI0035573169
MKIAIIGTGAMACFFAARLSNIAEVHLLGTWVPQIKAIQSKGLYLTKKTTTSHHQVFATNNISNIPHVDMILILVKTYQTERAAKQAKYLHQNNMVVTLQNGIGNWKTLREHIAQEYLCVGTTTQAARITSLGIVENSGDGSILLGNTPEIYKQIEIVANNFRKSGFDVKITDNIENTLWEKLIINSAINPLTAILQKKNGYLIEDSLAQKIMHTLAYETYNVAKAQGLHISFAMNIKQHINSVVQKTSENYSSMCCDYQRNSLTEIDAICGEVIRRGRKYNVATPVNEYVYNLIKTRKTSKNILNDIWNTIS